MKLSEEGKKIFKKFVAQADKIDDYDKIYINVDEVEEFVAGLIKAQKELMRI